MQILLDGIFKGGVKNEALRRGLKEQANQQGNQFLYDKLKEADPQAASKIHPNDIRRVIRALEVFMGEKMPISQLREDRQGLWGKFDISLFALDRQRPELYDRINARVERMFERGIIDEIKRVEEDQWGKTAKMIIGVQEIQGFLRGEYDLEETKQKIKLNTRRLAKRQLTWFRQEKRLTWVTVGPEDTAESVARTMLDEWKAVR
jgi:tRNA dimethylallyltransferase